MSDILRGDRTVDMAELIFVVDSESVACQLARHSLEEAGYSVRTFSTIVGAEQAQHLRPSLMLTAVALPDGSGVELCRRIRRGHLRATTALIVLTAGASEEDSCAALEAGADNCLAKPFSPRELLAGVKSALRHLACPFSVETPDIVIDHAAMKLSVRGNYVVTTALEFRLVNYMARHRGHAFTRDVLLDAVWGETNFVTPRSVDACIRRLREKIEPDVSAPTYLKTIRGIGYRFDGIAVWPSQAESCRCVACAPTNEKASRQIESFRLLRSRVAS